MSSRRSGSVHRLVERMLSRVDRQSLVELALVMILLAVMIIAVVILQGPQIPPIFKNIDNSFYTPAPTP